MMDEIIDEGTLSELDFKPPRECYKQHRTSRRYRSSELFKAPKGVLQTKKMQCTF